MEGRIIKFAGYVTLLVLALVVYVSSAQSTCPNPAPVAYRSLDLERVKRRYADYFWI